MRGAAPRMRSRKNRGMLVLIGGFEDKKRDKLILRKTVEINNAKNIAVIPSASSYPIDLSNKYRDAFRDLRVPEVNVLDIRYPDEADRPEHHKKLKSADMIFFTGGDQTKLFNVLGESRLLKLIKTKWKTGTTVAGTSAGAAIASDPMIYDGDDRGLQKGVVHHSEGFGFLKGITMDTHFTERGRITRLSQFLSSGLSYKGIGLGEDTSIFVFPNDVFEVAGSGIVTCLNSKKLYFTNYDQVQEKEMISIDGIKTAFLSHGDRFNLKKWHIVKENSKDKMTLSQKEKYKEEDSYERF